MGHSEGAIAVATVTNAAGRGPDCGGVDLSRRLARISRRRRAFRTTGLALVGESDPWFEAPVLHGDCGAYLKGARQRSLVFRAPNYLAAKHWLSSDPAAQVTILDFLYSAVNEKGN
jgi:hypothetical protein